jgi:predicted RNA binding protein YcfA (HicA-like mRNA interferase family)
MPKLPRISSREAIRSLERLGFEQVRQTGSHVVMKKETEFATSTLQTLTLTLNPSPKGGEGL